MVTGSAALVLGEFADRTPAELKAVLMNTAETDIRNSPAEFGGELAAVSRIGAGEVRVDAAVKSPVAAWDTELESGVLSFGFHDVTDATTEFVREVTVKNYTGAARSYAIGNEFRFAEDEATGAVSVTAPASVTVPANGTATFDVTLTIDGAALGDWLPTRAPTVQAATRSPARSSTATSGSPMPTARSTWAGRCCHARPATSRPRPTRCQPTARRADEHGVGASNVIGYSLIGQSPEIPTKDRWAEEPDHRPEERRRADAFLVPDS